MPTDTTIEMIPNRVGVSKMARSADRAIGRDVRLKEAAAKLNAGQQILGVIRSSILSYESKAGTHLIVRSHEETDTSKNCTSTNYCLKKE